jgi:hypothetical protein
VSDVSVSLQTISTNLEDQVPGYLLIAFGGWQGYYDGGILAHLHVRMLHHRNRFIPEISSILHDNRKVPLKHVIAIPMLTAAKCSHLVFL